MAGELALTYEKNFAPRADGRYVCTMAAHMAMLRDRKPRLALPEALTEQTFAAWQAAVKQVLKKQLSLPPVGAQPAPVMLSSVQRDGYRTEKWEFYPDDFTVVPFLVLIPDGVTAQAPAPAVMCYLDSCDNKEFAAGEPLLDHPNCQQNESATPFAQIYAQNGLVTFVFDNPGIGECSIQSDPALGATQSYIREILCHGLLETGCGYVGLTVFQRLQFLQWLDSFPYADQGKLAIAAHGLGTEAAIAVGLLDSRIQAIVYGDILRDDRHHYVAATEEPGPIMAQDVSKWHTIPGKMADYSYADLCAAFAPRYLGLCEGSNEEFVKTVRNAYAFCNAESALQVGATVKNGETLPKQGLSHHQIYAAPVFSTTAELKFLKNCFAMD